MQDSRKDIIAISIVFGLIAVVLGSYYFIAKPYNKKQDKINPSHPVAENEIDSQIQTTTITGEVKSVSNGNPLVDVKVTIGTKSTNTNLDGLYKIDGVPVGDTEIIFTLPKFESVKVRKNISENEIIKAKLISNSSKMIDKKQSKEAVDFFISGSLPALNGLNSIVPFNKTDSPVRIFLDSDNSDDINCLNSIINDINTLTDTYYFQIVSRSGISNIWIDVTDKKTVESQYGLMKDYQNDGAFWGNTYDNKSIVNASIWVNSATQNQNVRCFVMRKYFTHAIGFPNSPTTNKDSILYPDDSKTDSSWSDIDKTIISMMYNYDLPAGLDEAGIRNFFK